MNYSLIASITLNHEYVNGACDWFEATPSAETKKIQYEVAETVGKPVIGQSCS